jgi:hypothetical protein
MKSDLEIENAAWLPLRRSLAGHNPIWHHRCFQAIGHSGAQVVHCYGPEGDGPDAEGVPPESLSDPPEGAIAAAHIAAISARRIGVATPPTRYSTASLAQPRGNAVHSE